MATLSLEHGNSDGSCLAYAWLGSVLGMYFGDYQVGFRFGRLGLDLVEKRGLDRFKARVYLVFAVHVVNWTQNLSISRGFLRRAFEAAQETGDLSYVAYSCVDLVTNFLAAGDPLGEAEREAENGLEFVRKMSFGLISDCMIGQLRLIRVLRGLRPVFTSFDGAEFDEGSFEQRLESKPQLAFATSWYWIRKLQACVYAGDFASAVSAASKAASVLWTTPTQFEVAEYHFYAALARAACCDMAAPDEQLDVGTVVKASQAVSGEIVLGELIKTLLRMAIEHAGAERGLLILFPGDEPRIAAEATTGRGQVEVMLRQTAVSPAELPESVLHYVVRTRESVILDDALAQSPFSADAYLCQKHVRSVLCLPLVKQAKLIGALYLENNLASHVFTPARISVLDVLASQAAISLENARLYNDLREREARIRRLVDSNIIGIVIWDVQGRIIDANEAFLDIVGYTREDLVSGRLGWTELTPDEWRDADDQALAELKTFGTVQPREKEYFRKDGSRVPILIARALFEWKQDEGVAFVLDMTDRKRAEEMLRASQERYRHLFEQMPIAMWQVDGRGIADLFAGLRAAGVTDLGTYLDQDPDFLLRLMDALIVEEVNEHAIKMFGAKDRNQLLGPSGFFWQRRPDTFRRAMESRFRGLPTFQEETKFVALDGREIDVLFTAASPESISERGISLGGAIDITDRIRARERLQQVQA